MKGIVLAGGSGTRLFPTTKSVSKQLLPVYDKPAIYYPISVLMLAGIRDILIISTPRDIPMIKDLMGSGEQFGVKFDYAIQQAPKGIAEAFIVGEKHIKGHSVCLILGDNLFYGAELPTLLERAVGNKNGATVFGYHVVDPQRFGVVEFDKNQRAVSIEEKPKMPKSNWAVTGLYFYDERVLEVAKGLKPSGRGELEITDVNRKYLEWGELNVELMGRGYAWLDVGTQDSLLQSALFVQTLEQRQGLKIACLEEIAFSKKYITETQLLKHAESYPNSGYGEYLKRILESSSLGIRRG